MVNVQQAKTHLSRLLAAVEQGEEVVIARDVRPVARLIPAGSLPQRRFGVMSFSVPDDFDAPLPAEELAAWE